MLSKPRLFFLSFFADSLLFSLLSAWFTDTYLTERISIIGDFAGLQKSYNDGIAFGIGLGVFQEVIIVCALIAMAVVAWRGTHTIWEGVGFGLIVGGGLANLIDRFPDGRVTDMIQVGTFPIFNIADSCISIGVVLLLVKALRTKGEWAII